MSGASDGLFDRPVLALDPGFHTAPIRRADVDAAGRIAVTGSEDGTVRVWTLADGKPEAHHPPAAGTGKHSARSTPSRSARMESGSRPAAGLGPLKRTESNRSTSSAPSMAGCASGSLGCQTLSTTSPSRPPATGWRRRSVVVWESDYTSVTSQRLGSKRRLTTRTRTTAMASLSRPTVGSRRRALTGGYGSTASTEVSSARSRRSMRGPTASRSTRRTARSRSVSPAPRS